MVWLGGEDVLRGDRIRQKYCQKLKFRISLWQAGERCVFLLTNHIADPSLRFRMTWALELCYSGHTRVVGKEKDSFAQDDEVSGKAGLLGPCLLMRYGPLCDSCRLAGDLAFKWTQNSNVAVLS